MVEVSVMVLGAVVRGRKRDERKRDESNHGPVQYGLCGTTETWSALRDEGEGQRNGTETGL